MSDDYVIVNANKRQYLSATAFGEYSGRMNILSDYHGLAVNFLVCNVDAIGSLEPPAGTWSGDTVIVASSGGYPGGHGIETATTEQPDRNLYALAFDEYEDISDRSILMLARWRNDILDDLAARVAAEVDDLAARAPAEFYVGPLFLHLGNTAELDQYSQVEVALRKHVGENWRELYERCKQFWLE